MREALLVSFVAARPSWRAVLATERREGSSTPAWRVELHHPAGLRSAASGPYLDRVILAALQGADYEPDWTDCSCEASCGVERGQELHDSECPLHGWFEGGEADG